jgi:hypothetical protein
MHGAWLRYKEATGKGRVPKGSKGFFPGRSFDQCCTDDHRRAKQAGPPTLVLVDGASFAFATTPFRGCLGYGQRSILR